MIGTALLVTGAASGIGRAVCELGSKAGYHVHALDRDVEGVTATVDAICAAGGQATGHLVDVTRVEEVSGAFESVAKGPRLVGLFASAGIDLGGMAHELDPETFRRVLDVNTTGAFLVVQQALRVMIAAGGGSIVLCGSPAAQVGFAAGGVTAYGASKGAIASMTRTLAVDYAPHGLRVNAVVPGPTDTDLMWAGVAVGDRAAVRTKIIGEVPLGRLAHPDEIARCVLWLLSDLSSYTTGSLIGCDGGVLAKSSISM
ncbi:SDR family NAD(P)-dependent oxidoreductase [Pseudonocardia spinosispora]|uniref:SDR family NAD(P)-dependent oxidoreductase n=1 Tax=Pseudonocardia spinosispora TaxID=103441 RepID=UPI00041E89EC|nr:SDR family NAD(P)-dependent oxidoreductase [Pseudonocardia spinosispora]